MLQPRFAPPDLHQYPLPASRQTSYNSESSVEVQGVSFILPLNTVALCDIKPPLCLLGQIYMCNVCRNFRHNGRTWQVLSKCIIFVNTVFTRIICALFFLVWPLKNRGA
jgi:hypothetical protein